MRSQPLWIIGAPRSGTTFLTAVLNSHPEITLTNEGRLLALLKQIIECDCDRDDLVDVLQRDRFKAFLKRKLGTLIELYYREALGVETEIWGDKHPPYCDPTLLSGREGARCLQPQSGSALPLIRELLPNSKFIHIWRDPEQVAQSLLSRGWVASLADGQAVWRQYADEITGFLQNLDPDKQLTVPYCSLLEKPRDAVIAIADFLDADADHMIAFLKSERRKPTPFSQPVRNLHEVYGT